MIASRSVLMLIAIAAVLTVSATYSEGPLAFVDDRTLQVTWAQAQHPGVPISVCNIRQEPVRRIKNSFSGFDFKQGEETKGDDTFIVQADDLSVLNEGQCKMINFEVSSTSQPNPDTYTGLLTVYAPGAGMIRREISLMVPDLSAEPEPPKDQAGALVFEDASNLTLTWAQIEKGVAIYLFNDGNGGLESLNAALTGFNFLVDSSPMDIDSVVLLKYSGDALGVQGESILELGSKFKPDPGQYKGVLVVSALISDKGTTDRKSLNLTIDVPVMECALEEIKLQAVRHNPFADQATLTQDQIPLVPNGTALPVAGTALGVLANGGDLADVSVAATDLASELITLKIDSLGDVGTYSGKIDFSGYGLDDKTVPVEVSVTDGLLWAGSAIGVGVLLSILTVFYTQRWRYVLRLNDRLVEIPEHYDTGEVVFAESVKGDEELIKYKINESAIISHKIQWTGAFARYKRSYPLLFDAASEDFKKIVDSLELAEDDARVFGEENLGSPFAASLLKLRDKKSAFHDFLSTQYIVPRKPAFIGNAAYLLKGISLDVGEATKKKSKADEFSAMIDLWKVLALKILRYRAWGSKLNKLEHTMSKREKAMLKRATARVEEAGNELLDAVNLSGLSELEAAEDLKRAYRSLAYLGGRYKVWVSESDQMEYNEKIAEVGVWSRISEEDWDEAETFEVDLAPPINVSETIRWVADALVIILGVVLAVYTGLSTLYFDKNFGTLADYLGAVSLAFLTPTALTYLTETIKQFGSPLKS